jgi:hypothetical protein
MKRPRHGVLRPPLGNGTTARLLSQVHFFLEIGPGGFGSPEVWATPVPEDAQTDAAEDGQHPRRMVAARLAVLGRPLGIIPSSKRRVHPAKVPRASWRHGVRQRGARVRIPQNSAASPLECLYQALGEDDAIVPST